MTFAAPHTPLKLLQPHRPRTERTKARRHAAARKCGAALRRFSARDGMGIPDNPWIITFVDAKSLKLEASTSAGHPPLSTCQAPNSTDWPSGSTRPFFASGAAACIYLSLFKKKKKKKKAEKRAAPIHGLAELMKKASTGWRVEKGLTRGNPWIAFALSIMHLAAQGQPIHASTGNSPWGGL